MPVTVRLPDDLDPATRAHVLRALARAPKDGGELLVDGQEEVFSRTEVELGLVEQSTGEEDGPTPRAKA